MAENTLGTFGTNVPFMQKIMGFIILACSFTALFVFYMYSSFKAIESKSKSAVFPLYFRIGVRLLILLGALYLIWQGQSIESGFTLALVYIFVSLIISFFLLRKIQAWRAANQRQIEKPKQRKG